jgi:hypothetical protein
MSSPAACPEASGAATGLDVLASCERRMAVPHGAIEGFPPSTTSRGYAAVTEIPRYFSTTGTFLLLK